MKKKQLGNVDSPVKEYQSDRLSMSAQVNGLAKFIKNCETPITISVQGEWGSGKTSFFNMVKNKIEQEDEGNNCVFAEFNTWQFVQFDMSEQLAANMIIALTNELYRTMPEERKGKKESVFKVINGVELLKTGGRLVGNVANGWLKNKFGVDVKGELEEAGALDHKKFLKKKEEKEKTAVDVVTELKENFYEVVKDRLGIEENAEENLKKRIIFFVDDLDRLSPDKAIEILEVLKMFLDCEHCVFVLAIDYKVVVNGVAMKYKNSISEEKGAEFFEKMIQVVYTLPDTLSHTERYIAEILRNNDMNISLSHEFTDLVKSGKRDNPRAIKRLMNSYILLEEMRKGSPNVKTRQDEHLMLFATLCLQNICPEVYNYLYEKFSFPYDYEKGTNWFNKFKLYCYRKYYNLPCEFDMDEEEFEILVQDSYTKEISMTKLGFLNTFFEKIYIGKYLSYEPYDVSKPMTIANVLNLKKTLQLTELTRTDTGSYSDNDSVAIVEVHSDTPIYTQTGTIEDAYKETIIEILGEVIHEKENEDIFRIFDDVVILDYEDVIEKFSGFLSIQEKDEAGWEKVKIRENEEEIYVNVFPNDATKKVKNVIELSEYVKIPFRWYSNLSRTKKLVEGYQFEWIDRFNFGDKIYYLSFDDEDTIYIKGNSIARAYYETIFGILNKVKESETVLEMIDKFDFLAFDVEESDSGDIVFEEDSFLEKYGDWRWAAVALRDSQIDYYIKVDGLDDRQLIKNVCELAECCKVNFFWYGDPYMADPVVYVFS